MTSNTEQLYQTPEGGVVVCQDGAVPPEGSVKISDIPAALKVRQHNAPILAEIAALECDQARPQRDYILYSNVSSPKHNASKAAEAYSRVETIDEQIKVLRGRLI